VSLDWPFRTALVSLVLSAVLLGSRLPAFRDVVPLSPFAVGVVGWTCGYLVVVTLLVVYRFRDRALRGRPDYALSRWSNSRMVVTSVIGFGVGCAHAMAVADWLAS
jgi:hypothetical protein